MKKRVLALLGACLLAVSAVTGCSNGAGTGNPDEQTVSGNPGAEGTKLVILHTNDMHGYMQASDGCLGIGAVAQLKKDYQQQGYDVLLMDAGDYLQGNSIRTSKQSPAIRTSKLPPAIRAPRPPKAQSL